MCWTATGELVPAVALVSLVYVVYVPWKMKNDDAEQTFIRAPVLIALRPFHWTGRLHVCKGSEIGVDGML